MSRELIDVMKASIQDIDMLRKSNALVKEVMPLLQKPMPDVGPPLIKHLAMIDAYSATLLYYAAMMNANYRMAKDMHKDTVQVYRMIADMLEGAADSIRHRVSLGQSIISYFRQEMDSGLRG